MRCTDVVQQSPKCMQYLFGYLLLHDKQHCNVVPLHTHAVPYLTLQQQVSAVGFFDFKLLLQKS